MMFEHFFPEGKGAKKTKFTSGRDYLGLRFRIEFKRTGKVGRDVTMVGSVSLDGKQLGHIKTNYEMSWIESRPPESGFNLRVPSLGLHTSLVWYNRDFVPQDCLEDKLLHNLRTALMYLYVQSVKKTTEPLKH